MAHYPLIILKAPNAVWQLYFSNFFFFFFTLLDNYATLSFSPQTFSTAGLDSPTSKEHDSYFTNNTEKNLCDFPTPQPPTYLTLVPIFLPSFPHPCSCRGQIFSLYTRSHTSYFLRDINPLTIFTSLLHLQFPISTSSLLSPYVCHSLS